MNKLNSIKIIFFSMFIFLCLAQVSFGEKKQKNEKQKQLLTRIDFGNSYITGQTLKSGAVYLLQRKKNEIKSMLKYRENYRKEIFEENNLEVFKGEAKEK